MTADLFALSDAIAQKERELDALRSELAQQRASSRLPTAEAVLVCGRLQDHRVALLASEISEVIQMAELSSAPDAPVWLMGLLALGSRRLPILDLFARETGIRRHPDPDQYIVLTEMRTGPCGLTLDAIDELVTIPGSQIARPTAGTPFGAHVIGLVERQASTLLLLSAAPLSLREIDAASGGEVRT